MASEVGSASNNSSNTTASNTRKREVADEENSDISRIREDYRKKKNDIKESGEAAVVHLNSDFKNKIEQTEKNHETQMQAEREILRSQSENIRRTQKTFENQLNSIQLEDENSLKQERQDAATRVKQLNSNENHTRDSLIKQAQLQSADLSEKQNERSGEIETRQRDQEKKEKLHHADEMNHLHDAFQKEEARVHEAEEKEITGAQQRGKSETENIKNSFDKSLTQEREHNKKSITDLQSRDQREYSTEKETSIKKIAGLRHQENETLFSDQKKYADTQHKIDTQYTKEQARTTQAGEKQLQESRKHYNDELKKEKDGFQEEKTEVDQTHAGRVHQDDAVFEDERVRQKNAFLKSMQQEKKHFDDSFQTNLKVHKNVMSGQERQFAKDKMGLQAKNTGVISAYDHYQDDPFYQLKTVNANLTENRDNYVFTAEVPDHEIKNVKVNVLKDRIILTGERAFADELVEGDYKIASHNFQTFRQEVKLPGPVKEKLIQHQYENGKYTVTIPKWAPKKDDFGPS